MPVSSLNVDLSLNTAAFNRGIRNAERAMAQAAGNFERIGNSLAIGITAPLAGIGIAAIKASGDFEKLQKGLEATMTGAGYTINQVTQELDALREAAKAPGLDFEQAVKGSLRLQGVGLSAEQARNILEEFGNAVAATGGDASQLDRVTVQLAQIIGKGKILNEDLAILKENLPSISKTLVDAFGTADAEGLRKLNISTKDFVNTITKELANTPRVVGGLSNSIVNAQVSIQQAAAKLGDTLNKTFNISGNLEKFSEWIVGVADRFGKLDEGTQKAIIGVGLFAAALGPAVRLGGILVNTYGQATIAFLNISKAFQRSETATLGLATAFGRLNLATRLTIAGLAIGIVIAAVAAWQSFSKEVTSAAIANERFKEGQKQVTDEISKELAVLNKSITALKSTTSSTYDRKTAIKELLATYPDYLQGMNLEKATVQDLDELQQRLTKSITKGIAERQKAVEVNKIYEEQVKLQRRIEQLRSGASTTLAESRLISGEDLRLAGWNSTAAVIQKLQYQVDALGKAAIQTGQEFDRAFGLQSNAMRAASDYDDDVQAAAERLNKLNLGAKTLGDSFDDLGDKTNKNTKALKDYGDQLERDVELLLQMNEQQAKATLGEIKRFGDTNQDLAPLPLPAFSADTAPLTSMSESFDKLSESVAKFSQSLTEAAIKQDEAKKKQDELAESAKLQDDIYGALGQTMSRIGSAFGEALGQGEDAWKQFARVSMDAIADLIGEIVRLYVAHIIQTTAKQTSALGAFAIPISIAAGAAASGAIKAMLKTVKLAKGGLAYGPTFAVVGDNPGAKSNPEVIAPLDKLKGIIGETGGGGRVEVFGTIKGSDIYISNERAGRDKERVR